MPLPEPRPDEDQDEFMGRCIEWMLENDEAESEDQAIAICADQWDDAQGEIENDEEGKQMDKLTKQFEIKQSDGWWIASTPVRDRDDDRVLPLGLDLSRYRENPIIAWAHDYYSPYAVIGRAAEMQVSDTDFRIRPEFREPANEHDPMTIIRRLIDDGFVRALSVGFQPIEWEENEWGGYDFTKVEILEVSVVPIPANQEALRRMVKSFGDAPEDNADSVMLDCLACGEQYEWSRTLAALVLTGKVPQICANCAKELTEGLRSLDGAVVDEGNVSSGDVDETPELDGDTKSVDGGDPPETFEDPAPANDGGESEQNDGADVQRSIDTEANDHDDDELPPDVLDELSDAIAAVGDLFASDARDTEETDE